MTQTLFSTNSQSFNPNVQAFQPSYNSYEPVHQPRLCHTHSFSCNGHQASTFINQQQQPSLQYHAAPLMQRQSQEFNPYRQQPFKPKQFMGVKPFRQASMGDMMMQKMNINYEKGCSPYINDNESSPTNQSTEVSSDEEKCFSSSDFDVESLNSMNRKMSKQESSWKRKVKTELCKFWLSGLECENQHKEQGCGFAHG